MKLKLPPLRGPTVRRLPKRLRANAATAKERWAARAFLAPSLMGVLLFFILPFGQIIRYAVTDNPVNLDFVGMENFKNVWGNLAFKQAAANTFMFSIIAVPLAVVLALMLAMVLEARIPGKSRFRTFFLSPMMVPVASVVLIWQVIFHHNGALNGFLQDSAAFQWVWSLFRDVPYTAIDWLKTDQPIGRFVIVLLFLWKNLGYNMILFMSALSNIPKEQLEAAAVDGASAFRRFWVIKFRYLSPSILFVTILSLINSFKVFREVYLLTGNYGVGPFYLLQHFMNNTFRSMDFQKLSAAALIMALVVVVIIGVMFLVENSFGKDVEQ